MNSENNQLQKKDYSVNNQLTVITNNPLLYYPELRDVDVYESKDVSNEEKQIILASLNYPKIRNLDIEIGNENFYAISKIIGKSIWDMGITEKSMTQEEQEMFIPVAIQEIQTDFAQLSIEDIRIAFKKGARRHYGEFYQMSMTTLNCWLNAYIEETKPSAMMRLPYIKKVEIRRIIDIVQEENIILSDEELVKRHQLWINSIYKSFEDFKLTGNYDLIDFGNKFYNYCKKLSLIKLNEKQQEDLWNKAVHELKDEYHPKNGRTFGKRIDLKNIYDNLKNTDEIDKKTEEIIVIRAKKLTVMYFFTKLVRQKMELKDVIEHHEKLLKEKCNGTEKKVTSDKKD